MRITRRAIQALEKPPTGYTIHRDDAMPNFGVRITSSGAISFVFEKRINGRPRRLTIGRWPVITCEKARTRVQRLALDVMDGHDPITESKLRRANQITLQQALNTYVRERDLREATKRDINGRIKSELKDWLTLPIKGITRSMVVSRHQRIGERSPSQANATMRYLRAILNFASEYYGAADKPLLENNPTKRLSALKQWYRIDRRTGVIKPHDMADWWTAVDGLATDKLFRHGPEYRDYFQWLILTGMRRNEALSLKWADIDFRGETVTVQLTKNHLKHTLPLTDQLLTILERRRSRSECDHVFAYKSHPIDNLRHAMRALSKHDYPAFTPHDLRRTFATVAESLDLPSYTIKRLLNHKQGGDVTAGYVIFDIERLRSPMQRIGEFILKSAGLMDTAPVVELKQGGAA